MPGTPRRVTASRGLSGPARRAESGRVVEFDDHTGLGVVESVAGARNAFHCTQVADGSRSVTVGMAVRYEIVPGGLGAWEAGAIEPAA